ncbi:CAP domain-containing protein [Salegentibacter chungangensis]|uniref:CAP domain-containing protein n=1 Tax=Salegentibacter chungangensis TaxID=1335724 RepID=A0ABW3NSV0_9FLAO
MRKSTRTLLMMALLAFSFTSCTKDSLEEEVTAYDQVAEKVNVEYTDIELEILAEVNDYRASLGLAELKPLAEISVEAEDHNVYMAQQGQISHDNFGNRYESLVRNVNAQAVSENVAYGYRTAESVVKAWVNSSSHRHNIEGKHTHFGISVLSDEEGKNYFTNIFVRK